MIGTANSPPNFILLYNCLIASLLASFPLSLFIAVNVPWSENMSPNVPMSSALYITAAVPKPPPTAAATNFCFPDNLFKLLTSLAV